MPDLAALVGQLQAIARNTCTCEPVNPSIDPEEHGSFCNFAVVSLAVDGRAVLGGTVPVEEWLGPAAMEIVSALAASDVTDCAYCPTMAPDSIRDMFVAGWERNGDGDWVCPACSKERADIVGDET